MDDFLDRYTIPKLNQEQVNYLNRPRSHKEIEESLKTSQPKINPEPDGFIIEFYQTFKEDLIPIFLKLSHKTEREEALLSWFYEATITLILKSQKHPNKREPQTNLAYDYQCKNTQ